MRHTGDKPYKCPHCPYACIQAISYKTHLRNKHPGLDGLYSCLLCTFKSVSKENYTHHMSDHKRHTDATEDTETVSIHSTDVGVPPAQQTSLQLTDATLQQLEGILPGNITAAQLIYSCLNVMSQDGEGEGVALPTSEILDGAQTITIQVPGQEVDGESYFFTIQQKDGTTALVLPPDANYLMSDGLVDQTEVLAEDVELKSIDGEMVITNIEPLSEPSNFSEIIQETDS